MRLDDACDILGVVRVRDPHTRLPRIQGTRDEAQKLYRKLAMLHHPDRSSDPGATAKFQSVGEAWERVQQFHDQGFGVAPCREGGLRPASATDTHPDWPRLAEAWGGLRRGLTLRRRSLWRESAPAGQCLRHRALDGHRLRGDAR